MKGIAQHFRLAQLLQFTHALACEIRDIFETCCPPVKTQRATASATAAATLRFQRCCRFSLLRARKCCSLLSRYTIRYTQSILAIRTDPRTALEISLENAAADLGRVRQRKGEGHETKQYDQVARGLQERRLKGQESRLLAVLHIL